MCDRADSLSRWEAEGKAAVWLRVPIALSRCAAAASAHGFTFHHARKDHAVLARWLGQGDSRLPGFATHQVGVAGRKKETLLDSGNLQPTVGLTPLENTVGSVMCVLHPHVTGFCLWRVTVMRL